MIEKAEFAVGLSAIALQVRAAITKAEIDAFYLALEMETEAAEWREFCRSAVKVRGWRFLPSVVEIMDALRSFRGVRPLDIEAVDAYERVLACGVYASEGGTTWTWRHVRETCGAAAAEAFLAAGGSKAFETTWDESKRRAKFVGAYCEEVREEPTTALLPPGKEQRLLASVAPPTEAEAVEIIRELEARAPKITRAPVIVTATEERLEALRRQAAEILAETEERPA